MMTLFKSTFSTRALVAADRRRLEQWCPSVMRPADTVPALISTPSAAGLNEIAAS